MAWLVSHSGTTRTILSVLPSTPRSENNTAMPSVSDVESSRPVHRLNGRVMTRRPDHNARSRTVCPFRLRLAWWSKSEPPKLFEEYCDNCKANRGKKLAQKFYDSSKIFIVDNILKYDKITILVFIFFFYRNGSRYQYTALEPDSMGQERMELERKARQHAQNACQHYLRFCPRYALLQHLNDIGSR